MSAPPAHVAGASRSTGGRIVCNRTQESVVPIDSVTWQLRLMAAQRCVPRITGEVPTKVATVAPCLYERHNWSIRRPRSTSHAESRLSAPSRCPRRRTSSGHPTHLRGCMRHRPTLPSPRVPSGWQTPSRRAAPRISLATMRRLAAGACSDLVNRVISPHEGSRNTQQIFGRRPRRRFPPDLQRIQGLPSPTCIRVYRTAGGRLGRTARG